jgi:putative glutamine transport system substrate-binding protein
VRVGISIDINSPFVCLNESKGELDGFDIQLVKQIVDELESQLVAPKLKAEFLAYQWTRMFEAVENRDVDLIISAITKTPERMKKFKLSDSYFTTKQTYSYFKEFPPIDDDFENRILFVHDDTTSFDLVKGLSDRPGRSGPTLDVVQSPRAAFQTLMDQRKRGIVVTDNEIAQYIIKKLNLEDAIETKTFHLKENREAPNEEKYGIGVNNQETELLKAINDSLKKLSDRGGIKVLEREWFSKNGNPCGTQRSPAHIHG